MIGKHFAIAVFVEILISCLGLLAITSSDTENGTKEFVIRKVLGASVSDLSLLLFKGFLKLVIIGFMLAVPLSICDVNIWLNDFSYMIELSIWYFLPPGIIALTIALAAVLIRIYRAAYKNPIESIRYE